MEMCWLEQPIPTKEVATYTAWFLTTASHYSLLAKIAIKATLLTPYGFVKP